jgi:hypothetical protein
MPRIFNLASAQALLPKLEPLLRQAVVLKCSYDKAEAEIQASAQRVTMLGGSQVDRAAAAAVHARRDATASRLKETIEEINLLGCILKDLDSGLVDFPCRYRGREVYLCWRLGESGISFWHDVEAGFRGRKPIDPDFLENHREDPSGNEPPH